MKEHGIIYQSEWYINDDGFKETLEEVADEIERNSLLTSSEQQRLAELRVEIKKFITPTTILTK